MKEIDMDKLTAGKLMKKFRYGETAEVVDILLQGGWCPQGYAGDPPDFVCEAGLFGPVTPDECESYCRSCIYRHLTGAGDSHD